MNGIENGTQIPFILYKEKYFNTQKHESTVKKMICFD